MRKQTPIDACKDLTSLQIDTNLHGGFDSYAAQAIAFSEPFSMMSCPQLFKQL